MRVIQRIEPVALHGASGEMGFARQTAHVGDDDKPGLLMESQHSRSKGPGCTAGAPVREMDEAFELLILRPGDLA